MTEEVRTFATGANRDVEEGKHDYEGFLSPAVIQRFGAYMHKNRHLRDGSLRDSDNWQKGIPLNVYMKSLWRHFLDIWCLHRKVPAEATRDIEEALCGLLFNSMGYLHEILKARAIFEAETHTDLPREATPKEFEAAYARARGVDVPDKPPYVNEWLQNPHTLVWQSDV